MNSFSQNASSLPIEIIQLIISFLSKPHLVYLLINPPSQDWLYATASVIYRQLVFTQYHQLSACYNLFDQTRQRRQQQKQVGSTKSDKHGFYSTINYSTFVRQLDLSVLREKEKLSDSLLIGLTIDCQHLCNLNLYNCYTLTTDGMTNILLHCPQLEKLSLAGASGLDVSCFLDSRVLSSSCCQHLRALNLNLLPLFFNPPTTTFAKCKRQFKNINDKQVPRFPKLQELKLGMVYKQDANHQERYLFTLMVLRCDNLDILWMDSLSPSYIKICLDYCQHVRLMTLRRCYFYEGMFTSLFSQHKQQRSLERLEIHHCFPATYDCGGNKHKANMDIIWTELETADYHRLEWLGCKKMVLPLNLLNKMVTQVSGCYLTRFDCPDSMTDTALLTLMTRCPSLTHFSICMYWTFKNTDGYLYDRQQSKRVQLTLPVLMQALTTWKNTLEWLEITVGRDGPDVYRQNYDADNNDGYDDDDQRLLPKKLEHSLKEQQMFIEYLCEWNHNGKIQVLLLGGMALRLSMDTLERLGCCFINTRYLAFNAKGTMRTGKDLEQAMSTWKRLDGSLCINQIPLMAKHHDPWLDWKWMESRKDQFRRWKFYDLIS